MFTFCKIVFARNSPQSHSSRLDSSLKSRILTWPADVRVRKGYHVCNIERSTWNDGKGEVGRIEYKSLRNGRKDSDLSLRLCQVTWMKRMYIWSAGCRWMRELSEPRILIGTQFQQSSIYRHLKIQRLQRNSNLWLLRSILRKSPNRGTSIATTPLAHWLDFLCSIRGNILHNIYYSL